MDFIQVKGVSKAYAEHQALRDVSLTVPEQSIFGLLGPNGAGKTTLIRIINQIIEKDQGEILVKGQPLAPEHIAIIGYLPEERGLYKKMKVGDQLLYLAQLRGLTKKQAMEQIRYWFKRFEIADWWGKKVEDLSKGMAQKVQFISTVMHKPKLIILDEPFSGFDPVNAELIKDEILELRRQGATIIFSTHRMESVEQLCDHVGMIHKSQLVLNGSKEEVKKQYSKNVFTLHYLGEDPTLDGIEIVGQDSENGEFKQAAIKAPAGTNPNDLLRQLIDKVEVHGFREEVPSMNDIFISIVKEDQA
ncbi:MAG TPA: ABC transporter ATP-binding protein [Cytophagales bacterium]|nr:ABC transporter ATP-binding protein [Cytophagales bacterium]HAA22621.1 ABC transporter ATP-binding protein [Cytophagales bacterium]HAP63566.1 ABC transporter ATP-binding protein [Cytophagales bacterium]